MTNYEEGRSAAPKLPRQSFLREADLAKMFDRLTEREEQQRQEWDMLV